LATPLIPPATTPRTTLGPTSTPGAPAAPAKKKKDKKSGSSKALPAILIGVALLAAVLFLPKLLKPKETKPVISAPTLPISIKKGEPPKPVTTLKIPEAIAKKVIDKLKEPQTGPPGKPEIISFEFERTVAKTDSDKLKQLRELYTFLKAENPFVLTLSDNIQSSKAKEILVFPYPVLPNTVDPNPEKTGVDAPTANVTPKETESVVSVKATVSPEKKAISHSLVLETSATDLVELKERGFEELELTIVYGGIDKLTVDAPKGKKINLDLSGEVKSPTIHIKVLVWYNPCKTTEAELLDFNTALDEIVNCYAEQAQLENAEFHGRYWDNKYKLETTLDYLIEEKPVRFTNVLFTKEILGAFEKNSEAADKVFERNANYWEVKNGKESVLLLKDRYDLIDAYKKDYDDAHDALDYPASFSDSLEKAKAAANQKGDSARVELLNAQEIVLDYDSDLFRKPFDETLRKQYADAVDTVAALEKKKVAGTVAVPSMSDSIIASLEKKYGTNKALVETLQKESERVSKLIAVLEAEKAKTNAWEKTLTLKQPLSSLKTKDNGVGAEWVAVALPVGEANDELQYKIGILTAQKRNIESIATALKTAEKSSIVQIYSDALKTKGVLKEGDIWIGVFDNPVVEREFRARRYLQEKYWLKNIDEAFAFYDLVHAIEEKRDWKDAYYTIKDEVAEKAPGTKLDVEAEISYFFSQKENSDVSNRDIARKILKDLEAGKIKKLLGEYNTDLMSKQSDSLSEQEKSFIGGMQNSNTIQREFGKLNLIQEENKDLIKELSAADGLGEVNIDTVPVLIAQKYLDTVKNYQFEGALSDKEGKFFKYAFDWFVGLEVNYGDFALPGKTQKASDYAKEIAAHFSKDMNYILSPAGGAQQVKDPSGGRLNYAKSGKDYVAQYAFDAGPWFDPKEPLFYFVPLVENEYGYLSGFWKMQYNLSTDKPKSSWINLFTYKSASKEPEAGPYNFIDGFGNDKTDQKKVYKTITQGNGKNIVYLEFYQKDANNLKLQKIIAYNNEFTTQEITGFGTAYYIAGKNLQQKAKPANAFLNFIGITYSEPIADLSAEANKDLVAGYAGLLAKETLSDYNPMYYKSPAPYKGVLNADGKDKTSREFLKAFLFELNELLPKDLNPNHLAGKITETLTEKNVGNDLSETLFGESYVEENVAEPKLLGLLVLLEKNDEFLENSLCFSEKAIFEGKTCGAETASDDLLAEYRADPADTKAPEAVDSAEKIVSLAVSKENALFAAPDQCDGAKKCIIEVKPMLLFGNAKENIVKAFLKKAVGQNFLVQPTIDTKGILAIVFSDSVAYKLKEIRLFGGSTQKFSLPNTIVFVDFSSSDQKLAYSAQYYGDKADFIIYVPKPVPITFTVAAAQPIKALGIYLTAQKTGVSATTTVPSSD